MINTTNPSGGQGAVEFDDSAEAGAVESRISLIRALIEDIAHSGETAFTHDITIDGAIWRIHAQKTSL